LSGSASTSINPLPTACLASSFFLIIAIIYTDSSVFPACLYAAPIGRTSRPAVELMTSAAEVYNAISPVNNPNRDWDKSRILNHRHEQYETRAQQIYEDSCPCPF